MMKPFTLALALGLACSARADVPTLSPTFVTGVSLMSAYSLRGDPLPPSFAYHIGTSFLHIRVNGKTYDLGAEGLGFLSLNGSIAGGAALCGGPSGTVSIMFCGGAAAIVRDPQGHGLVGHWQWKDHLPLVVSAGTHF